MADPRQELGERIRSARAAKGWKQKHLAAEVEVEPITVSRWERGATTPDLEVLNRVASATGKPVSFFVAAPAEPDAGAASLEEAAARIETAAVHIATEIDRLAALIDELRAELARSR
ncbi:MAG: helix-turn-helix domain-containing protein [Gaiellaceae bacterium]